MPELPEVETIRTQLSKIFPYKIKNFRTSKVAGNIIHTKLDKLKGKTILSVSRKGKMLDFLLDDGRHILSHLGMTGSWRIAKEKSQVKHTHLEFESENREWHLYYVDQRRFGHLYLLDAPAAQKKLDELGADLTGPEFTFEYFSKSLLKYPERLIKVSLLDQKLFAGTGNYIANEICARGGVLPDRKVLSLTSQELKRLYLSVRVVIEGATQKGGTTFQGGYSDTSGEDGGGAQNLVVFYQKICQLCKKTPVTKTFLAQRGTYFCTKCQK